MCGIALHVDLPLQKDREIYFLFNYIKIIKYIPYNNKSKL